MDMTSRNIQQDDSTLAFRKTVSSNLKIQMALSGVTQGQLADALSVTQSSVSQKLRGVITWTLDDIARASKFFRVPPTSLVSSEAIDMLAPRQQGTEVVAGTKPRFLVLPTECPLRDSNPGHAD